MSGNSKVIGVTMSRPRSSCHSVRCSVRADTRSYCSLVCVQSLCQSHPTSTLFVWNMESRQQPVVFVLSDCHRDWNARMLHIKHYFVIVSTESSQQIMSLHVAEGRVNEPSKVRCWDLL